MIILFTVNHLSELSDILRERADTRRTNDERTKRPCARFGSSGVTSGSRMIILFTVNHLSELSDTLRGRADT